MAPKSYATQFTRVPGSGRDYARLPHPDQSGFTRNDTAIFPLWTAGTRPRFGSEGHLALTHLFLSCLFPRRLRL